MRASLLLGSYLLVACIQTAPVVLHLTTSIPFGNDTVSTVPRLNLWTLWWDVDRVAHAFRGYWQAPIFYPEPNAFAYSETQLLTGLVASPLWWTSGSPALTYNVLVLASLTLVGFGGYLLMRALKIPFWPAAWAGLIMEMLPTISDQLGVLQSTTVLFPILMTLLCLVEFSKSGRMTHAIGMGLALAACFHTSSNMALFFGPIVVLGVIQLAPAQLVRMRSLLGLVLAAVLVVVLVAPVAIVQSRMLATMPPHDMAIVSGTSAHFGTYREMAPTNLLRRHPPDHKEATLGPGVVLPILAAVGALYGVRRRKLRAWTAFALVGIVVCTVLSFGPLLAGHPLGTLLGAPYRLLDAFYPGFGRARNLWRFGALAQMLGGTLAGLGLAAISGRARVPYRMALCTGAALVLAVDVAATPIPLLQVGGRSSSAQWIRWLAESPSETTVVHVPMAEGLSAADFERTTLWMNDQIYHHRRIANGYAAYIPSRTALLLQVMPRFPDGESIRALQYFGIDHVVAASEWVTAEHAAEVQRWARWIVPELVTPEATIYRVVAARPEPR